MAAMKPAWFKNLWCQFCAAKTVSALIQAADSNLTGNPLLVFIVEEKGGCRSST